MLSTSIGCCLVVYSCTVRKSNTCTHIAIASCTWRFSGITLSWLGITLSQAILASSDPDLSDSTRLADPVRVRLFCLLVDQYMGAARGISGDCSYPITRVKIDEYGIKLSHPISTLRH